MFREQPSVMFARTTLLAAVLLMTTQWGCQPAKPAPTPGQTNQITVLKPVDPSGKTFSPDEILSQDASATRLHDIEGALLDYYSINRQMPAELTDLKDIPAANLNSPASGQPYVYAPDGLWIPNQQACIVVYDPALSSDGTRWCLTMIPPKPGSAVFVDVQAIPEAVFLSYQPAGR
jgi:hypothetical protein